MHFLCPRILAIVRRLLALVSAIIFVDALLFTALTPLVPLYAEEYDLSKAGAGLLVGAYGAGALLGGIPGGLAALRFGPKRAVVGGLVLLVRLELRVRARPTARSRSAERGSSRGSRAPRPGPARSRGSLSSPLASAAAR